MATSTGSQSSSDFPSTLSFKVHDLSTGSQFNPRIGKIVLGRAENQSTIYIDTPGLVTATSRGVVPHLSRDHHRLSQAIRWVHVPFETFLEHNPPVPTLQTGRDPLHTFLGYPPSQHVVSMSIRDPFDGREMPPNGNEFVSAYCVRGVRKVTQSAWRSYILACKPDIVVPLSDVPLTKPPYSQKRLTKSIERSTAWLADILRSSEEDVRHPLNVLVPMAGGSSLAARRAFSDGLTETLYGKEAENVMPLKCLDEGVSGYIFDLVPLRLSLSSNADSVAPPDDLLDSGNTLTPSRTPTPTSSLLPLMKASLEPLPRHKLRLVNSVISPHEILRLIQNIGIDLFDAHWAQRAADIGVALNFRFPAFADRDNLSACSNEGDNILPDKQPRRRNNGKRDLGYNLFDAVYAHDFSRLADDFLDGASAIARGESSDRPVCTCAACSPLPPSTPVLHSSLDSQPTSTDVRYLPPYTRAYLHHLLLTHEMSGLTLLALHNLAVLDGFFAGIRSVLSLPDGASQFAAEVNKFSDMYDEDMILFDEARTCWTDVELARGKGRMAREKAKQVDGSLGTAVDL